MSSSRDDAPARLTLRNAVCPEQPLAITGPVAIVAALAFGESPSGIDVQCVMHARALHQLVAERFPQSTLRFVARDVDGGGRYRSAEHGAYPTEFARDCARLGIARPELSLRSSQVLAQSRAALREMLDERAAVGGRSPWAESIELDGDLWAQRRRERSWVLPATIDRNKSGRIAWRSRDELRLADAWMAVDLCTVARNDGLPIVLLWATPWQFDALTVSVAAELRRFSQPVACIPVSVGTIRTDRPHEFGHEPIAPMLREQDPRIVRHWLLCGDSRRKQVQTLVAGQKVTDHFETCAGRVRRVLALREAMTAMIARGELPLRASHAQRSELDRCYSEFVHTLRTEFNVEGASQVLARVCKRLAGSLRTKQREGLAEMLATIDAMAGLVAIA